MTTCLNLPCSPTDQLPPLFSASSGRSLLLRPRLLATFFFAPPPPHQKTRKRYPGEPLGEFRDAIRGILDNLEFERSILQTAKQLFQDDLYRKVVEAHRARAHAYHPRRVVPEDHLGFRDYYGISSSSGGSGGGGAGGGSGAGGADRRKGQRHGPQETALVSVWWWWWWWWTMFSQEFSPHSPAICV